jgi:hypothetical protein
MRTVSMVGQNSAMTAAASSPHLSQIHGMVGTSQVVIQAVRPAENNLAHCRIRAA